MTRISTKPWLFVALMYLVSVNAVALPSIGDFLTDEQIAEITEAGEITNFYFDEIQTDLLPEVSQSETLRKTMGELGANFSIEGLFFIPREMSSQTDEELLRILNLLCSVSELEGLEYFSASRGEMRLLFEECWRIDEEGNQMADLTYSNLPEVTQFTIHQKDLTFGKNKSSVLIKCGQDSLYMSMKNLTNMRYNGFIKVIDESNFQTAVLVIPVEEGIIYYGNMSAKTLGLSFIVEKASNSFYNRMKALFTWFQTQYQ